jgi:hypothetical protein
VSLMFGCHVTYLLVVSHFNIFLKFEEFTVPDMQIVQMRTGQDTLLVDQPSSAMSE